MELDEVVEDLASDDVDVDVDVVSAFLSDLVSVFVVVDEPLEPERLSVR